MNRKYSGNSIQTGGSVLSSGNQIYLVLLIYAVIAIFTIFHFDGTGDNGDSISHFLFSKYAPHHPELYFDHWAKPVFVLLSSPFAQFGFTGIKFFNALATFFTILVTYKIAIKLEIRNAILVSVFLVFTPVYFSLTFSGLTEPLFALFISIGIYLLIGEKYNAACIILSFLPFVRSEGLIVLGVVVVYLLVKRKWKRLPLLAIGHVVFSIAGYFVYHDFLWVFRKIPYAHLSSIYGHGELSHFAWKLFYILGLPLYILFCLGLISMVVNLLRKKSDVIEQVLFFFLFLTFFAAHSLFWYLGIFGSMGLVRVFICVVPVMALIALKGFNFLTEEIPGKFRMVKLALKTVFISLVIVFPFTSNKAALDVNRDLKLKADQKLEQDVTAFVLRTIGKNHRLIYSAPYLGITFNIDPFNPMQKMDLNKGVFAELKTGDVVIWDNWFATIDSGLAESDLDCNPELVSIQKVHAIENGRESYFSIYLKK